MPEQNPFLARISAEDEARKEEQAQAGAAVRQKELGQQEARKEKVRGQQAAEDEAEGGEGALGEEEKVKKEAPKKTPAGAMTFFTVLGVGLILATGFALFGGALAASLFFGGPIGLGLLAVAALVSPFVLFYGGRALWNGLKKAVSALWNGLKTAGSAVWSGLKNTAEKAQKNSIAIGMVIGIAALAVCLVFAPALLGAGLAVFVALGAFAISTLLGFLFRVAEKREPGTDPRPFTTYEKIAIALCVGIFLGVALYFALPLILGVIGVAALAFPVLLGIALAVGGLPLLSYGAARLLMAMSGSPVLSGLAVASVVAVGLLVAAAAGLIAFTLPIFIVAVVVPLIIGVLYKYRDAIARFFGFTPNEKLASAGMEKGDLKNNVLAAEANVKAAKTALAKVEPLVAKAATAAGKAEKEKDSAIKEAKAANAELVNARVELKVAENALAAGGQDGKAVEKAQKKVDEKQDKATAAQAKAQEKITISETLTADHQKKSAEERITRLVLEDARSAVDTVAAGEPAPPIKGGAQTALATLIERAETAAQAQAKKERKSIAQPSQRAVDLGVARAELREAQKQQKKDPKNPAAAEAVKQARTEMMAIRFEENTPEARLPKMQERLAELEGALNGSNMQRAALNIPATERAVRDLRAQIAADSLAAPNAAPEAAQKAAKAQLARLAPATAKAAVSAEKAEKEKEQAIKAAETAYKESVQADAALAVAETALDKAQKAVDAHLNEINGARGELRAQPGNEALQARVKALEAKGKVLGKAVLDAKEVVEKAQTKAQNKLAKVAPAQQKAQQKIAASERLTVAYQAASAKETRARSILYPAAVAEAKASPEGKAAAERQSIQFSQEDKAQAVAQAVALGEARVELRQAKAQPESAEAQIAVREAREKMMALRFRGPASPERIQAMEKRLKVLKAALVRSPGSVGTQQAIQDLMAQIAVDKVAMAAQAAAPVPAPAAVPPLEAADLAADLLQAEQASVNATESKAAEEEKLAAAQVQPDGGGSQVTVMTTETGVLLAENTSGGIEVGEEHPDGTLTAVDTNKHALVLEEAMAKSLETITQQAQGKSITGDWEVVETASNLEAEQKAEVVVDPEERESKHASPKEEVAPAKAAVDSSSSSSSSSSSVESQPAAAQEPKPAPKPAEPKLEAPQSAAPRSPFPPIPATQPVASAERRLSHWAADPIQQREEERLAEEQVKAASPVVVIPTPPGQGGSSNGY